MQRRQCSVVSALERTPRLHTAALRLDPLRVDDAEEVANVLAGDALYEFTGGSPPTAEILRTRDELQVAGPQREGHAWHNWIVREREVPVGYVQASVTKASAEIAWVIALRWQGNGRARAAAGAMCDWLRRSGVRELTAHIHPDHGASIRIAEACGLRRTELIDDDGEHMWQWRA